MSETCQICDLIQNVDYEFLLFESEHWKSYLSFQQHYPGRSIIVCKKHVESFELLSTSELLDFQKHFGEVSALLKEKLDATCFNTALLMNGAYAEKPYNPHVHFHVIPRYDHPVAILEHVFEDNNFGNHYVPDKSEFLTSNERQKLYEYLIGQLPAVCLKNL